MNINTQTTLKMKLNMFLILNVLIPCLSAFGQDYLGDTKSTIKFYLKENYDPSLYQIKYTETVLKIDTMYKFDMSQTELQQKIKSFGSHYIDSLKKMPTIIDFVDTLAQFNVLIEGKEKIEIEFFFIDNYQYRYCDSIIIKYYCKKCLNDHIKSILEDNEKDRQWKKQFKNSYISKHLTNTTTETSSNGIIEKVGSAQMNIQYNRDTDEFAKVHLYISMMDRKSWNDLTK